MILIVDLKLARRRDQITDMEGVDALTMSLTYISLVCLFEFVMINFFERANLGYFRTGHRPTSGQICKPALRYGSQ